jgi:Protein of unknown function (DUF2723)
VPASRRRLILLAVVLLFLVGHVPSLSGTLEDLDSFNFALGLRDFDPRKHQPHPPGYPVIIGLGKLARPVAAALGSPPGAATDARALALVSALSGALAVVPLFVLFRRLDSLGMREAAADRSDGRALAAVVLAVTAPLFWFTAARPLSDVPGLLLALSAQALVVGVWVQHRTHAPIPVRIGDTMLSCGAMMSAVAIGARSQALWLVAPILALALVARRGAGATRVRLTAIAAFGVTCLAWLVPMLSASGGVDQYLATLAEQAGEDFVGVEMVWTTPSARVVVLALRYVLLDVWGPLPVGVLMAIASAAGLVALLMRARTALLIVGVLWLPYFVFHLLFQETATSRYDLPLVPPMAWLATQGLLWLPRLALPLVVVAVTVTSLCVTTPALLRYRADGSPIGRAMADLAAAGHPPAIAAHNVFVRAFEADGRLGLPWSSRRGREWLEVTRRWRETLGSGGGSPGPLWFIAEPRRTDLALVDRVSLVERRRYHWTFDAPRFIRGTRPDAVAWFALAGPPGWFAGDGWALTPELAGLARRDGAGLERGPIVADLRRRAEPVTLLIGGRHLGSAADPPVRLEVRVDDAPLDAWTASAGPFLRVVSLPPGGIGGEGYARLTAHASPVDGSALPPVAIEQFDVQSVGVPVWGFDQGWHEAEFDRRTGRSFRWTSGSANLRIAGATGDVELRLSGEAPIKYLERAPMVLVRVGSTVLARETPSADFAWRIHVPVATLAAGGGVVTIATDAIFRPGAAGSADRRELGLRLFEVAIAR